MYMRDWVEKLRLILSLNERNILEHAGSITHDLAVEKATHEYDIYKKSLSRIDHLNSIRELDEDLKRLSKTSEDKQEDPK